MARDEVELGIIAGGREEYVKSLRSQFEREVAELHSARDRTENNQERAALNERMEAVRRKFAERLRNSLKSLF